MAARRLLIVMLILLGVSAVAGALIPTDPVGDGTGTTETTEETSSIPTQTTPPGEALSVKIAVGGMREVIPARVGDQIALTITSKRADQVEIPLFGLIEPVARVEPARFDLYMSEEGDYGVRLVSTNKPIARIAVKGARRPARAEPGPG